jgi:hypothetical protein
MGMFDTIHVKPPLVCPVCGAEVHHFQTKEFDCVLANLRIGSVLSGSSVMTGIVKDSLWCEACYKARRESAERTDPPPEPPIYLVIWRSILAGVEQDLAKAEARLAAVDRLDLIAWLDEAQREAARWRRHYHHLFHDVQRWHEHLARANEPEPEPNDEAAEKRRAFRRFFELPQEILTAPDPLAAILARNQHADEETDD